MNVREYIRELEEADAKYGIDKGGKKEEELQKKWKGKRRRRRRGRRNTGNTICGTTTARNAVNDLVRKFVIAPVFMVSYKKKERAHRSVGSHM